MTTTHRSSYDIRSDIYYLEDLWESSIDSTDPQQVSWWDARYKELVDELQESFRNALQEAI